SGPLTMMRSTISGSTAFGDHPTNGTAAYGGGAFSYGVDLIESTISGNRAIGTHNPPLSHWEIGGGLFVARNGGRIDRSTIANNYAIRFAGGVTQEGDLLLRNSTVSGNATRDDDGGGVRVRQVTSITIENSTIVDNQAGSFGGGLSFTSNALPSTISSTIIAGNRSGGGGRDTDSVGTLSISGANNLVQENGDRLALPADTLRIDPFVQPLGWYGGPTQTHALREDSPAIDAGNNVGANVTDQRGNGFARVFNAAIDIGAFEFQERAGTGSPIAVALPISATWASLLMATLLAIVGAWHQRRGRLLPRERTVNRRHR
ncbi:MAG: right-handed parallel beta-helix repeat-containing protein, partial [Dokdonella sp.]